MELKFASITQDIIGAAYEVYNTLRYGFLEKVYQRALQAELVQRGHKVEIESPIKVYFKDILVGEYFADIFVDNKVIVELQGVGKIPVK